MSRVCRKRLNFGKVDFYGKGRKVNEVEVEVELRLRGGEPTFVVRGKEWEYTGYDTPKYYELSICGDIWNSRRTDVISGGQNLDTIARYIRTPAFLEVYDLWKKYHLNSMHPGTPEQEAAISEWRKDNDYDYGKACEYLKGLGLYEVPFHGKTIGKFYNGENYTYCCGWVIQDLPDHVVKKVMAICQ